MVYRFLGVVATLATLAGCGLTATRPAADSTALEQCKALNYRYAQARDSGNADAYGELFAENAVFYMGKKPYEGRDAIITRLREGQDSASFARLLIDNMYIERDSDTSASGVVYFSMYYSDAAPDAPRPIETFRLFMGEYHDRYTLAEGGCKLAERKTVPLFMGRFTK